MTLNYAPEVWVNEIGGGYAIHCAACHKGIVAVPENADADFWTVPMHQVPADAVCNSCQHPIHDARTYLAGLKARNLPEGA